MKKGFKLIVPSFLAIIVCVLLLAGSTFALFTSDVTTNISVGSATVKVSATLGDKTLYSVTPVEDTYSEQAADYAGSASAFGVTSKYKYVAQELKFATGGTATIENGTISLTNMVPGDRADFNLGVKNDSDVDIKYRLSITGTGDAELLAALQLTFGGQTYTGLTSYKSAWFEVPAGKQLFDTALDSAEETYAFKVVLPVATGNTVQKKNATYNVVLEAVQANAKTTGVETVTFAEKQVQTYEETNKIENVVPTITTDPVTGDPVAEFDNVTVTTQAPQSEVTVTSTAASSLIQAAYQAAVEEAIENGGSAEDVEEVPVELKVSDLTVTTNTASATSTIGVDIELHIGGEKVTNASIDIPVEVYIGSGMYIQEFNHDGTPLTLADSKDALQTDYYYYDSVEGKIYFLTRSFSPFSIIYSNGRNVQTFEQLKEALTHDHITVRMMNNITAPNGSKLNIAEGVTFDGDNNTLVVGTNWNEFTDDFMLLEANGITIKNLSINANKFDSYEARKALINVNEKDNITLSHVSMTNTGWGYSALSYVAGGLTIDYVEAYDFWTFIYQSGIDCDTNLSRDMTISHSTIDVEAYTTNFGGGENNSKLIVTDSTIAGWTSYGSGLTQIFNNVNFKASSYYAHYNYIRPYDDVTFNNCTFTNTELGCGETDNFNYYFNNCIMNENALSKDNFLLIDNDDNVHFDTCLIFINNYRYGVRNGVLTDLRTYDYYVSQDTASNYRIDEYGNQESITATWIEVLGSTDTAASIPTKNNDGSFNDGGNVGLAVKGDTIHLGAGTYTTSGNLFINDGVTLIGHSPEDTIIQSIDTSANFQNVLNVIGDAIIKNIKFLTNNKHYAVGPNIYGISGSDRTDYLSQFSHDITIDNCAFDVHESSSSNQYGINFPVGTGSGSLTVTNSSFSNLAIGLCGLKLSGTNTITVSGNEFTNCTSAIDYVGGNYFPENQTELWIAANTLNDCPIKRI